MKSDIRCNLRLCSSLMRDSSINDITTQELLVIEKKGKARRTMKWYL
jgi:hypothetical protein